MDPTARAEFSRKHPEATVRTDCRDITAEDYVSRLIQLVEASVPCTPWTRGGSRRGLADVEGTLMAKMSPKWRDAYRGRGMPMVAVECTLGFERITPGGTEEELIMGGACTVHEQ